MRHMTRSKKRKALISLKKALIKAQEGPPEENKYKHLKPYALIAINEALNNPKNNYWNI